MIPLIILFILLLDQFTKFLATSYLTLNQPQPVLEKFFYLTLVYNRGAAFGILKNQLYLFILTSVVTIVLIYLTLLDSSQRKPLNVMVGFGFILAGASGNLIDRLLFGHVIDFLDFTFWPVFNVADSAITVGAVLLGWHLLFNKKLKA